MLRSDRLPWWCSLGHRSCRTDLPPCTSMMPPAPRAMVLFPPLKTRLPTPLLRILPAPVKEIGAWLTMPWRSCIPRSRRWRSLVATGATVVPAGAAPESTTLPPLMVVPPVQARALEKVTVPAPSFTKAAVPVMRRAREGVVLGRIVDRKRIGRNRGRNGDGDRAGGGFRFIEEHAVATGGVLLVGGVHQSDRGFPVRVGGY